MDKLRLVYEQTCRAIWMSHLDTMRTLQRAVKRAGIPIRYSEGFNPHELISILLPLSVGTASLCQMADIRVREESAAYPNGPAYAVQAGTYSAAGMSQLAFIAVLALALAVCAAGLFVLLKFSWWGLAIVGVGMIPTIFASLSSAKPDKTANRAVRGIP